MSADTERDFWDQAARTNPQDAVWSEPGYVAGVTLCLNELFIAFSSLPSGPNRILDLGCGIGRLTHPLARTFPDWHVIGCDISASMLEQAGINDPPNTSYVLCDGRTIPDVGILDGAFSVLLFQHLPAVAVSRYIAQLSNLIRPGGIFCFQYVEGEQSVFLSHHYDRRDIERWLIDNHFDIIRHARGERAEWTWVTARRR